mgnify:CR=1 FL=1
MLRSAMQKRDAQEGKPEGQQLSDADKSLLRENLFEALVRAPTKQVRSTLGEAINHIATHDFPKNWPNLLPQILSGVSESLKEVCASKVGVTAVSFVRLNSQGGFARLLDPTVNPPRE